MDYFVITEPYCGSFYLYFADDTPMGCIRTYISERFSAVAEFRVATPVERENHEFEMFKP